MSFPRSIQSIIDNIIRVEGDRYTNHASDRGGPTKYGITLATLRQWRNRPTTALDVERLSEREARDIYANEYITGPGFHHIIPISEPIAYEVIEAGVLSGQATSARWMQTALNRFNRQGRDYPDLVIDGRAGPATRSALQALLRFRGKDGETVMLRAQNSLQGAHFLHIGREDGPRPQNQDFMFGWFLHRIVI